MAEVEAKRRRIVGFRVFDNLADDRLVVGLGDQPTRTLSAVRRPFATPRVSRPWFAFGALHPAILAGIATPLILLEAQHEIVDQLRVAGTLALAKRGAKLMCPRITLDALDGQPHAPLEF
jgi:hypothetical protein